MIVFSLKLICKNIFMSFKIIIKSFEYSQISLFKSNLSFCYTWSLLWSCNMNSVIMGRIESAFVEVVYFALTWPCMFLVKSANTWNIGISFKQLQHSGLSLPFSLIWVNMSKQLCWHGSHHPDVYIVLQNRGKLTKKIPLFEIYLTYRCVWFQNSVASLVSWRVLWLKIVPFFSCVKLVAVSYAFLAPRGF